MIKYKVFAKENMELPPHTWTKGLDYEVIEGENSFRLTSNQGELTYNLALKIDVLANFEMLTKDNFESLINQWHDSVSDKSLHDYLGLTVGQYSKWIETDRITK